MIVEYAYKVQGSKRWEFVEGFRLPLARSEAEVLEVLNKLPHELWVLEIRPIA